MPQWDYREIQIDGNTVTLQNPDARIDLGGIAKGYIADQMKAYLNQKGITSGYINLGGNVFALGAKTDGSAYTIGIQRPFAEGKRSDCLRLHHHRSGPSYPPASTNAILK